MPTDWNAARSCQKLYKTKVRLIYPSVCGQTKSINIWYLSPHPPPDPSHEICDHVVWAATQCGTGSNDKKIWAGQNRCYLNNVIHRWLWTRGGWVNVQSLRVNIDKSEYYYFTAPSVSNSKESSLRRNLLGFLNCKTTLLKHKHKYWYFFLTVNLRETRQCFSVFSEILFIFKLCALREDLNKIRGIFH